jgi:hypothetical protein
LNTLDANSAQHDAASRATDCPFMMFFATTLRESARSCAVVASLRTGTFSIAQRAANQ